MKTHHILYNEDVYAITVDLTGEIQSVEVSRGNCHRPYETLTEVEIPDEVINRLYNRVIHESTDGRTGS